MKKVKIFNRSCGRRLPCGARCLQFVTEEFPLSSQVVGGRVKWIAVQLCSWLGAERWVLCAFLKPFENGAALCSATEHKCEAYLVQSSLISCALHSITDSQTSDQSKIEIYFCSDSVLCRSNWNALLDIAMQQLLYKHTEADS